MAEQIFVFVQVDHPGGLGPPDGRYVLRDESQDSPQHIVVLTTVKGTRPGLGARRSRKVSSDQLPQQTLSTTRVTVIDPVPLSSERQARAWLSKLDEAGEIKRGYEALNRVRWAHRIASADSATHELMPEQASAIRAGWGSGEQLAFGGFTAARELRRSREHRRTRSAALRPQERLAVLLGGRGGALLCEEFALRARADLDSGRIAMAALELDRAYALALREIPRERREDLSDRLAELAGLAPSVTRAAQIALSSNDPEPDSLQAALERLEAALRARTAVGFT